MKISGNTILITGGTSGIGFELATQLLKLGNTILITGRDQTRLDDAQRKLPGIYTFKSDVSEPAAITALATATIGQFPALNILINNAGIMRKLNLHEKTADLTDVTREIETNLNGPIRMVKAFLPQLKAQPEAAIMNVSSGLAFVPLPISPVYCATKAAMHSFTQSLRVQMKHTHVNVFELAPPLTETSMAGQFDAEDLRGSTAMPVSKMVATAIAGMEKNVFEIRPGQSNQLKLMSRIAPGFIFKQLSKPTDRMLAQSGN